MHELVNTFSWWAVLSGLGILAFPITYWLFGRFWDRGWAFAKILGLGLLTYWVWIVGSLRILAFETFTLWIGIVLIGYLSYLVWSKHQESLWNFVQDHWRLIVFEEFLFGIGLLFWSWVRAHQPDINGLEKFMDFGFVNSLLRTRFFPPPDMWLAGETINYYYFGHLVVGVVTKLSGISSAVTYNLMIATLLGLAFTGAFSLGGTLAQHVIPTLTRKRRFNFMILAGLTSGLVFTFAGNLHTVVTVISKGADSYWYPDATRYIPYTIHEFPLYSFVVSDLHGHVNNIPFVLLMLALLLSFLLEHGNRWRFSFRSPSVYWRLIALGLTFGILYMTNAMDAPIYLFLVGMSFLVSIIGKRPLKKAVLASGLAFGIIVFSAFALSLPFHLSFTPFTQGVAFVEARSSILKLLVLWGFFLFVGLVFVLLVLQQRFQRHSRKPFLNVLLRRFMLAVFATAVVLVVIPEFVYFKDIYIAEFHRANTMFKLVYQSFVLMSLMTGPVFVVLLWRFTTSSGRLLRFGLLALVFVFIVGLGSVLMYPYFAVHSYYNRLQTLQGLDGLSWMARRYPDDYAAISWLRDEVSGQPVIAEAVGESYTDFARVSANTGLPTVLGWRVHEWLWRGSFDEPGLRTGEVERLYTTADLHDACAIIEKYRIAYVFVGALERQQYSRLNEDKFSRIGNEVFSQGDTRIYRMRTPCGVSS